MQSDGESYCGDVVLDSFNMEYRDKDSILYLKYGEQLFDFFYEDFENKSDWRICTLMKYST